jgi:hypothetical protein
VAMGGTTNRPDAVKQLSRPRCRAGGAAHVRPRDAECERQGRPAASSQGTQRARRPTAEHHDPCGQSQGVTRVCTGATNGARRDSDVDQTTHRRST